MALTFAVTNGLIYTTIYIEKDNSSIQNKKDNNDKRNGGVV